MRKLPNEVIRKVYSDYFIEYMSMKAQLERYTRTEELQMKGGK